MTARKTKYIIEGENRTEHMFQQLERRLQGFDKQIIGLSSGISRFGGLLAGTFAVLSTGAGVNAFRTFEKLETALTTVTGSAEAAESALAWIEPFAAKTPFQLDEVVGAFIKLQARGLQPSEEALRSYGNTAIAMGKSLDQFVEAIADAVTGQFERLLEFGIKGQKEGDRITLNFRGVSTTIANEAAAIEGYLRSLGEVDFAGATERGAATLDGAFSNVGDAFSRLAVTIGKAGVGDAIKDTAESITTLVDGVNKLIETKGGVTDWADAFFRARDSLVEKTSRLFDGTDQEQAKAVEEELKALRERRSRDREAPGSVAGRLVRDQYLGWIDSEIAEKERILAGLNVVLSPAGGVPERAESANARPNTRRVSTESTGSAKKTVAQREAEAEAKWWAEMSRRNASLVKDFERDMKRLQEQQVEGAKETRDEIRANQAQQLDDLQNALLSEREQVAQALDDRLQLLRVAREQQLSTTMEYDELERRVREDAAREITEIEQRELDDLTAHGKDSLDELKRAVQGWGDDATEAILDFTTGTKTSFSDMVESILKDIARMGIRKSITDPLGNLLFDASEGLFATLFNPTREGAKGLFSGLFDGITGSRAAGGPGFRGQALMVGERGPELFVPSTTGNVVPLTGGAQNIKVEVVNASGQAVSAEAGRAIDGEYQIRLLIGDVVEGEFARGRFDRFMQAGFGVPRRGVSR